LITTTCDREQLYWAVRKRTATVFAMMFRSYAGTWNPNMHWTTAAKLD
jgi:hypothetical protein